MNQRFTCLITFEIENVQVIDSRDRRMIKEFIKDALESWGGQRPPEDWLFDSLEHVTVGQVVKKKRKQST